MANPENYTLVRLADSIKDKAILTYDALTDTITDSGTTAGDGSIQASSGSISLGTQTRTSGGDEVVSTDLVTGETFANAWYEINEQPVNITYTREYGTFTSVQRFSINTDIVENPVFDVHVPVNEVVFRLKAEFVEAHPKIELRITQAGKERWREIMSISAGVQELTLTPPLSLLAGDYEFTWHSLIPDKPLRVKGDLQTGTPAYLVYYQPYKNVPLATQEYVVNTVTGGAADDVMLKKNYDTDDDGMVDLADNLNGATTAGNGKYYGTDEHGAVGFHDLPDEADMSSIDSRMTVAEGHLDDLKKATEANKASIDKHETAINGHGNQLTTHGNQIATNTKNIQVAMQHSQSALDESTTVRKNGVNAIVADVSTPHKTITLKLMSQTGLVDSALIDLSSWFSGGGTQPPVDDHTIYSGFSVNPPMDEAEILRLGTKKEVPVIAGADITLTRSNTTPSYMWIWIPDAAGTVQGFDFSGFISKWQSVAVNVAGADGKFFYSPNKTSATSIEFEVKV